MYNTLRLLVDVVVVVACGNSGYLCGVRHAGVEGLCVGEFG